MDATMKTVREAAADMQAASGTDTDLTDLFYAACKARVWVDGLSPEATSDEIARAFEGLGQAAVELSKVSGLDLGYVLWTVNSFVRVQRALGKVG